MLSLAASVCFAVLDFGTAGTAIGSPPEILAYGVLSESVDMLDLCDIERLRW